MAPKRAAASPADERPRKRTPYTKIMRLADAEDVPLGSLLPLDPDDPLGLPELPDERLATIIEVVFDDRRRLVHAFGVDDICIRMQKAD